MIMLNIPARFERVAGRRGGGKIPETILHNRRTDPSICNEGIAKAGGKLERVGLRVLQFLLDQKM